MIRDMQFRYVIFKNYMRSVALIMLLLLGTGVMAQEFVRISGYVTDSTSGEPLIGAFVVVQELNKSTMANEYGYFSVRVEKGKTYTLTASYLGYRQKSVKVRADKNRQINIELAPEVLTIKEVVVTANKPEEKHVKEVYMSKIEMSAERLKKVPVLFGERDPLRTLQLMPGVQSAGEANTGLYVRGGGPDQVLTLLDEAVVYNSGHLMGMFSIFNPDAIHNVTLYKGGIPARYGGRLAAVLDVRMKEGNLKRYNIAGGIGLIASRLTVEGPIVKDKASFLITGRRTYIDWLLNLNKQSPLGYYFYDANMKVNWKINKKNRIYLSGYFGRDVFRFYSPDGSFSVDMPWGNETFTFRWNKIIKEKLFTNISLIYNAFDSRISAAQDQLSFSVQSTIRDFTFKNDWSWFPSVLHTVRFGVNITYHQFTPLAASAKFQDIELFPSEKKRKHVADAAVYFEDEWTVTEKLSINPGLRISWFGHFGPYTLYKYDALRRPIDSTFYRPGQLIKSYGGIEPRILARYQLNKNSSIKASFIRVIQYLHLVSSANVTTPFDLWLPASVNIEPSRGYEVSAGYFRNLLKGNLQASVEVYYRWMYNLLEFRDNYTPDINVDVDNDLISGRGWSYGAEFFLNKGVGKFQGWIGYTLSWTFRQFDALNNGKPFPARYDRRHDLSVVLMYSPSRRWDFGLTFVYGSGNVTTVPTEFLFIQGTLVPVYSVRNNFRLPPYHRMDISATLKGKIFKKVDYDINLTIYNVYNRKNIFFLWLKREGDPVNGIRFTPMKVTLFPIIPSLTFNFKW